MSNHLNKLAAEFNRYFTSSNCVDVPTKVSVSRDEWRALFTAIQQAEAKTDEPVACPTCGSDAPYTGSCGTSDSDTKALCKRQTHPAPGVPDDVARDAERWRVSELISEAALKHPDSRTEAENTAFNAYRAAFSSGNSYASCVDAAMLASPAQKGGE